MHLFRNILVGIDPPPADGGPAPSGLRPSCREAVRTALWLAKQVSAELTFFSVLPGAGAANSAAAGKVLSDLVEQARGHGIAAQIRLAEGSPPDEIVSQVRRYRHDLVVIGGPAATGMAHTLFGSTAATLVRSCPSPVWVALPGTALSPRNLLVATDLTPASDHALRLGIQLAGELGGEARILHVVDYPLDRRWSSGDEDELTRNYHRQVREAALEPLRAQVQRAAGTDVQSHVHLHVVGRTTVPDFDILQFLRDHRIDLLILGRTAREGLLEKVFGTTAQRLLPVVACPVLVVEP
jgi:nucleotide-binding universal stress UspA family protein